MNRGSVSRDYRHWRVAFLAVGILHAFAACSTTATVDETASSSLEEVARALDEGRFAQAQVNFRELPPEQAGGIEALNMMARLHKVTRRNDALLDVVQQILSVNPDDPFALEQLGLLKLASGDIERAENYLSLAVAVDPLRWMAWNGLGIIADTRSDFDTAQSQFRRALELVPGHPKVLANLGWSRLLQGDYEAAEKDLRAALAIAPDSQVTQSNLAFCIALQGRYAEAMNLYQQQYDRSVAANNVGYAALVRNDDRSAKRYFDLALELKPNYYKRAANNLAVIKQR